MTGLLGAAAATFAAEQRDRVLRLYQWLSERASFFRHSALGHRTGITVRTETTVRREGVTLLVGSVAASLDICPLCGNKLAPTQAEQARLHLLEGTISQETSVADSQSPRGVDTNATEQSQI